MTALPLSDKMSGKIEILIENVRKYRFLFDTSHENYKNVLKKAEAWDEIAQVLNMTSDAAKTKWKNLRDSYMRFKKTKKGETGQATKYSKWPWSSQMSFLDDTLKYRLQSSNITQVTREIGGGSLSQEPTSPLVTNNDESNQLDSPPEMLPPPGKKMRSHSEAKENISTGSEVDKVITFLQSNKSQEKNIDGVDHLFLSYAATFKTFRPRTQSILKLKLASLFSETELNELNEQVISQTTSASSSNVLETQGFTSYNYPEETLDFSMGSHSTINSGNAFLSGRGVLQNFNSNNN